MSRDGWDKYMEESHLDRRELRYCYDDLDDVADSAKWFDEQDILQKTEHKLDNIDELIKANIRVALANAKTSN